ncbi:MAG: apolipoprotein N-acyltransferase [bacterium]|uniref:Apolipoprotein N-acyltransferase n=2 Tax=Bacteria candidate phyla TaxID=1783234 RepID=A0A117M5Z4_UNCT6|nr:MAG: Apolipoprotein N-acyltransferase [candidate division TA06 bacterium 32_111]KUK86229.1 MAG: Apolipoprotein N-acyltransferase [candidate division TA06 bacterium 34_109]MDI6700409.1 apolipoprotein N-acyltransferase [bacterium]HAF08222.1 apolipoprotein N-acyltransferase [candidate division WOR-3 bacterium]HCP16785.1 apolipoprotein N-acyltransferase [candidate division WOR-3 bacterium]
MFTFIRYIPVLLSPFFLYLSLKFIDFGFLYIPFFSFVIFTISLFKKKRKIITFFIFFIYWLLTLFWILNLNVDLTGLQKILLFFGWIFLSALYAFLFSLPFFLCSLDNFEIFLIPVIYSVIEILMSSTRDFSFIWMFPSVSLVKYPLFIQTADIGGSYILTFFVIFFSVLIYKIFKDRKNFKRYSLIFLLLFLFVFYYGIYSLSRDFSNDKRTFKVTLIQPNLEGYMKESYRDFVDYRINMIKELLDISLKDDGEILIFPETSSPMFFSYESPTRRYIKNFAAKNKKAIFIGAIREEEDKDIYFNSIFLFKPDSSMEYYDKIRLVPFVEHLPYSDIFNFIKKIDYGQGDYTPGEVQKVFNYKDVNFSGYICFESIFPKFVSNFSKNGANFLINVSEDIWFIKGDGLKQHFYSGILRSVENRKYLVRVSNPGISAVIDWYGNIVWKSREGKREVKTENVKLNDRLTFFVYSDNIAGKILIYIFILFIYVKIARRQNDRKS